MAINMPIPRSYMTLRDSHWLPALSERSPSLRWLPRLETLDHHNSRLICHCDDKFWLWTELLRAAMPSSEPSHMPRGASWVIENHNILLPLGGFASRTSHKTDCARLGFTQLQLRSIRVEQCSEDCDVKGEPGCQRVSYCSKSCRKSDYKHVPQNSNDVEEDVTAFGHSAVICSLLMTCNDDDDAEDDVYNKNDTKSVGKTTENVKVNLTKEVALYRGFRQN
eukprot:scaffold90134_cov51-Cyclotella_meneghiniana.AAC.8